jgi:transposase-like protein
MSSKKQTSAARGGGGERSEPEAPRAAAHRRKPGRRTAKERKDAVLQLLAGKATADQLAKRFGVKPETVEGWRTMALEAMDGAFRQGSPRSPRELELERDRSTLERIVTRLTMKNELMERALKEFPTQPGRSRR